MVYRPLLQASSNIQNIFQGNYVLSLWNMHFECDNTTVIAFIPLIHLFIFWIYFQFFSCSFGLERTLAPKIVCIFLIFGNFLEDSMVIFPRIVSTGEKIYCIIKGLIIREFLLSFIFSVLTYRSSYSSFLIEEGE